MMMPHAASLEEISTTIRMWAREKKANVSLACYSAEIELWRKLTGKKRVRSILEVGCGSGLFLLCAIATHFAERGEGVDPAIGEDGTEIQEMEATLALIDRLKLSDRVLLRRRHFEEMLRGDNEERFELVIFRNSLHHIYPRDTEAPAELDRLQKCVQGLSAVKELLTEDGYLYVVEASSPNRLHGMLYNAYRKTKGSGPIDWKSKRRKEEWEKILAGAGWTEIHTSVLPINKWINRPAGKLVREYLSPSFLISASKRGQGPEAA